MLSLSTHKRWGLSLGSSTFNTLTLSGIGIVVALAVLLLVLLVVVVVESLLLLLSSVSVYGSNDSETPDLRRSATATDKIEGSHVGNESLIHHNT